MMRSFVFVAVIILAREVPGQVRVRNTVQHVDFNSPEGWALKYFTSATLLSGLEEPPALTEQQHRFGSVMVGVELGWLPTLSPGQARVGFGGTKEEDLNKAPLFARPMVKVGLPWRFSVIAAAPAPLTTFGIKPRLFALGVERPLLERADWRIGARAYGQLGHVQAPFSCPNRVLSFPAGSPNNPAGCVAESADIARLRYVGGEVQVAYRIRRAPRLTPHASAGLNYVNSLYQVNAQLATAIDHSQRWTSGRTFSATAGASYRITNRIGLTVDAFYTPLWVRREAGAARTNDGLFNVRALISYNLR